MRYFHGTFFDLDRFPDDPLSVYGDGGVSLSTHEPLARCYGDHLAVVDIPAGLLKLFLVSAYEWFSVTDSRIAELEAEGYDGIAVAGDVNFNSDPDDDFQPEDATFFWSWVLVWNTRLLNQHLIEVRAAPLCMFEDLPEVVARGVLAA
jgi:hypothetical protein